jgi:GAF domain-containing protein
MSNSAQSLSLERKIKMHEAREGIINRLAMTLPHAINLDRFLNVIVSELGRMMNVDRCDVIQLKSASELRISHEWRASNDVPSSLGTVIPLDLKQLSEQVDLRKPIRLDDISAAGLDQKVRYIAASLGTRSLLVVPVMLGDNVLGLVGLHTTRTPREWLDDEVSFLQSIAGQIAIGYQYTRLYTDKEREAETKRALLSIANALNARSDFREVSTLVLERAIALVGADYAALGVLDPAGRINLAAFKAAPEVAIDTVQRWSRCWHRVRRCGCSRLICRLRGDSRSTRSSADARRSWRRLESADKRLGCSGSFGARRARDLRNTKSPSLKVSRIRSARRSSAISCRPRSCTCAARCTNVTARIESSVRPPRYIERSSWH